MESHTPVRGPGDLRTLLTDTVGTVMYIGRAAAGSATSDPVWQIQRLTDTDGDLALEWADGDTEFDNVWDSRATLSYS